MANKKMFFLGILAMVLVLGMTVVGCDNGSTDSSGHSNEDENDTGKLIITGLTNYIGYYVNARYFPDPPVTNFYALIAAETNNGIDELTGGLIIADGTVTLNVWIQEKNQGPLYSYKGDDQNIAFQLRIGNLTGTIGKGYSGILTAANFTNGFATAVFLEN